MVWLGAAPKGESSVWRGLVGLRWGRPGVACNTDATRSKSSVMSVALAAGAGICSSDEGGSTEVYLGSATPLRGGCSGVNHAFCDEVVRWGIR